MSKVLLVSIAGLLALVSFQNCGKLKTESDSSPQYYLSSSQAISDNSTINGAEFYTPPTTSSTTTASVRQLELPPPYKTTVELRLKTNNLVISQYEPAMGSNQTQVYEIKTCSLANNDLYTYLKSEIKKIKLCTYVSSLKPEDYDITRCPVYAPMQSNSALTDINFYVLANGLTNLSMSENSFFNDVPKNPYCDLEYTTYCNPEDDAGRLKPVLNEILSQIDSSDVAACTITNP